MQLQLQLRLLRPASLVLKAYGLSKCQRKSNPSVKKQKRACTIAAETIYKRTVAYGLRNCLQTLKKFVRNRKKEVRLRLCPQKRKQTLKRCL
jgi:hypothetical protein